MKKPWQQQWGEVFASSFGISIPENVTMMRAEGRPSSYIVDSIRKSIIPLLDKQDWKLASRIALWHMVEFDLMKQEERAKERVLTEAPTLGQRRALVSRRVDIQLSDEVKEAMSYLQSQSYTINERVYDVMKKCRDVDAHLIKEVDRLKSELEEVHALSKDPQRLQFYVDYFADWRGRLYVNAYGALNYQGDHANRGLVRNYKEYPITPENLEMLEAMLNEEYDVNLDNCDQIIDNAVELRKHDKICYKALDAACALQECRDTGRSSYIPYKDATCSGFQHIAAMTGDSYLGMYVNIVGDNITVNDLYMIVVDSFMKSGGFWPDYLARFFRTERDKKQLRKHLAKPTVMLSGYGSTPQPIALKFVGYDGKAQYRNDDGEMVDCEANFGLVELAIEQGQRVVFNPPAILREAFEGMNNEQILKQGLDLATLFQKALFEKFPSIYNFIQQLKDYADEYYDQNNKCVKWMSPTGTYIYDIPWKVDMTKESVEISYLPKDESKRSRRNNGRWRTRIKPMYRSSKKSGFPPCFIHSFDAAVVAKVVVKCEALNIPIHVIHDAFGTTVEHMHLIAKLYAETMAEMYNGKDWIQDLFGIDIGRDSSFKLDTDKEMIM